MKSFEVILYDDEGKTIYRTVIEALNFTAAVYMTKKMCANLSGCGYFVCELPSAKKVVDDFLNSL